MRKFVFGPINDSAPSVAVANRIDDLVLVGYTENVPLRYHFSTF